MKLRVSDGQLRFRITNDELANLLQGAVLELELPLSIKKLQYSIHAEDIGFPLVIEEHESGFALLVNRCELESFNSREAIENVVTMGGKRVIISIRSGFQKSAEKIDVVKYVINIPASPATLQFHPPDA